MGTMSDNPASSTHDHAIDEAGNLAHCTIVCQLISSPTILYFLDFKEMRGRVRCACIRNVSDV
jgi:hypothetical protein